SSLGTSICQSPSSLQRAVKRASLSGLSFWASSDLPSIGINSSLTNLRTMSRSIRNSSGSSISTVYSPVGTTRRDVARRSHSRQGGPPPPQLDSGFPEFGQLLTWPKSETSDLGWGEGGGEGEPTSRSSPLYPTPLPCGEMEQAAIAARSCAQFVRPRCALLLEGLGGAVHRMASAGRARR